MDPNSHVSNAYFQNWERMFIAGRYSFSFFIFMGGIFMTDEEYMSQALALAREALEEGEVPVGCVIVWEDGRIVGRGRNRREGDRDALCHAELEAIRMACQVTGGWRLNRARLYVTLEPCPMCAGAILNARIPELHYAAKDPAMGSCGSVLNLFEERFGSHPRIYRGPLEAECGRLLSDFFARTRERGDKTGRRER